MSEDYFEIAWINQSKAVLHGHADGEQVERTLTEAERDRIWDMNAKQEAAMQKLLRELAARSAPA